MGARLVAAQETEEGKRWAEAKIKALTGGDPITARFMRQDDFEFIPQFKLVMTGNHKPGLRNVDEAIKRRMYLIPFTVTIPAERRDSGLAERLRAEAGGILAWAIEGCREWQRIGLAAPERVRAATDEYLDQQDVLGLWMEEAAVVGPNEIARRGDLYKSFKRWAEESGEYVLPQKRFVAALESRGFKGSLVRGIQQIRGIGLSEGGGGGYAPLPY
jgi:putative DNA primase/helicase